MRKISFVGIFVVVTQGILFALLAIFLVNQQYTAVWQSYPSSDNRLTVYIKDLSQEKQTDVQNYLFQSADEQQLFITRKDSLLSNDASNEGYVIGVYGTPTVDGSSLSFLNESILNAHNLNMLLTSDNASATLGINMGSINSVGSIPSFLFGRHFAVEKLSQLITDSATVNGTYTILGINNSTQEKQFMSKLAQVSGLSETALTTETSGEFSNDNFKFDILLIFLAIQIFLNVVLFLVVVVRQLPMQGKLALLGWSRVSFTMKIFGKYLWAALIGIPFFIVIGWLLSGWNQFSPILLSQFSMFALINLVLVVVELAIASVVVIMTKPLDAIHNRISKRPLYVFGIFAYLLVSIGIVAGGYYVDAPMQSLNDNAKLALSWNIVSDYQMLSNVSVGQDASSLSGQSDQLDQDFYDWYSSMADQDGVFLIHTQYYGKDILTQWENGGIYTTAPQKPFWYFTVSPNYLSQMNIQISDEELIAAKNGTRLYMLPDTLSTAEQNQMISWIRESDADPGDIQDAFSKNPNFQFITYKPSGDLFTWGTTPDVPTAESSPIIYVSTPQNMGLIETGSLRAIGFNGYIKFENTSVMEQHVQSTVLSKYDLTDNNLIFTAVQQYIDGLQKSLLMTIEWFGVASLILLILLIGLLITLATIFRISNQEKINVKKFLGFSFWQLYKAPILFLISCTLFEFIVSALLRSKFAVLLIAITFLLQLLIFYRYMVRSELKRILQAFKGE